MYTVFSALALNGLDARALVDELRLRMREELDYRREAANIAEFAGHFAGHPWVRIPTLAPEFSTSKVLTTEWVDGLVVGPVRRHRVGADEAARGRGDLALRPALGPPPRRVQRRPASRQLPVPPRRQRDVPRLRPRQALGARRVAAPRADARRHRRRPRPGSARDGDGDGRLPRPRPRPRPAARLRLRVDAVPAVPRATSSRSPATGCATRSAGSSTSPARTPT